jgi:DNA-binding NarL/FixJ family response regulator
MGDDGQGAPALRVLIADDHPVFAVGLRVLLDTLDGVEVVGEATTGKAAVLMARQTHPDLVLMDVDLPQMNGIAATSAILTECPNITVLMLTILDELDAILDAMRAGARGYLLKGAGLVEIARAIESVRQGEVIFGPHIADRIINHVTRPTPVQKVPFPELTDREREVLRMVADGCGNAAIARELSLSIKTVRNYLSRIFIKLQVTHRTEAAIMARREGLGT